MFERPSGPRPSVAIEPDPHDGEGCRYRHSQERKISSRSCSDSNQFSCYYTTCSGSARGLDLYMPLPGQGRFQSSLGPSGQHSY